MAVGAPPKTQRDQDIVDMYQRSTSIETLAHAFDISETRIKQILRGTGLKLPRERPRLVKVRVNAISEDKHAMILQLAREGKTNADIGRHPDVNLTREWVRQVLQDAGYVRSDDKLVIQLPPKPRKITDPIKAIIADYQAGVTVRTIAITHGVRESMVYKYAAEYRVVRAATLADKRRNGV